MKFKTMLVISVAAGLMAGLAACGGSGGGSARVSKWVNGPITAFGSIYVNGVKYDTSNAKVYVEDSPGSESDLKVGMNVSIETSSDNSALSVHFDDDVEGIVMGDAVDNGDGTVTLQVMGYTVTADGNTVFESHVPGIISAVEIKDGNIVEVSGSVSADNILASRLEVKAENLTQYLETHPQGVEVKGIVTAHNENGQTFTIGSLTVNYASATKVEMPIGNWDGLYVEVKSTSGIVNDQLVASKVELEDGGSKGEHEDSSEVEVKGQVSEVTDTSVTVNGQTFLLDANTVYEHGTAADLIVGAVVEVEGYKNSDSGLVARKIEFENEDHDGDKEVEGLVDAIELVSENEGTIDVNGMSIKVTNYTIMHDDSTAHDMHFNLSKLQLGDKVEVHYVDNGGTLTATKLERKAIAPL